VRNLRSKLFDLIKRTCARMGYTLFSTADLLERENKFAIGDANLRLVDGVKLLHMKVWTEGERPCKAHAYHKVRTMNSHKNALALSYGDVEHLDYVCSVCTHKMCVTKWGEHDA
jgi:hypothetical protein